MPLNAFDLHVHPLGWFNEIFLVICYACQGSIIKHQSLGIGVEGTWGGQTRAVPCSGHSCQGCLRNEFPFLASVVIAIVQETWGSIVLPHLDLVDLLRDHFDASCKGALRKEGPTDPGLTSAFRDIRSWFLRG